MPYDDGRIYIYRGDEAPFTAIKTRPAQVRSVSAPKVIRLPRQASAKDRVFEARICGAEIFFTGSPPPLRRLARDLNIVPELVPEIEEDSWGTRDSLEIWFQEIEGPKLTVSLSA
jgi:hypothetical protein